MSSKQFRFYRGRLTTLVVVLSSTVCGCMNRGVDSRPHYKRVLPFVVEGQGKEGYRRPCNFLGYCETTWNVPEQFGEVCRVPSSCQHCVVAPGLSSTPAHLATASDEENSAIVQNPTSLADAIDDASSDEAMGVAKYNQVSEIPVEMALEDQRSELTVVEVEDEFGEVGRYVRAKTP